MVTDDFVEASDTNLESHTPSGGTAWTHISGTAGNVQVDGGTDAIEVRSGYVDNYHQIDDPGSADQFVEVTLATLGSFRYVLAACRAVDSNNCIGVACYGTGASGLRLTKFVAGVPTDLISIQGVAGAVYRVECEGTTIRLYENSVQKGTDQTVTDFQTETSQGIVLNNESTGVDLNTAIFSTWSSGALGITASGAIVGQGSAIVGSATVVADEVITASGSIVGQGSLITAVTSMPGVTGGNKGGFMKTIGRMM